MKKEVYIEQGCQNRPADWLCEEADIRRANISLAQGEDLQKVLSELWERAVQYGRITA